MEWNDELHEQSCAEVDAFLYGVIDEQIEVLQENQWIKYDESCMSVKYSLLIKTIYDLVYEGWSEEMLINDCTHHINAAKSALDKKKESTESTEEKNIMSEDEFLERLEKAKQLYLD